MNLVPYPKKYELNEEASVYIGGWNIVMNPLCDSRIFKACQTLKAELEKETSVATKINKAFGAENMENCISICAGNGDGESYTLSCTEKNIKIAAPSLAGAFYGIQTLRQLLKTSDGNVNLCEIEDSPDMANRGFYHDISRGRVPTVDGVKKLIDLIAYYKMNSLQLYIEHAFDFTEYRCFLNSGCYMTAEEILELDDYCYENFIDFVPSLSTFGHLYQLLESKEYKHLCELEDFTPDANLWKNRMLHHTIDASNPESFEVVASLIDQYIPLFRSKYFNICCDETFDLCNGRNKGKDKGALYLEFTTKLINHVSSHGKTVMMWGDIALHHPEILGSFPKDMIMLCWDYANTPNIGNIEKFAESGLPQIVCPGCSCWNHFCEVINYAKPNIVGMIDGGVKNGALGLLNTSWGDYGHVCSLNCTLYGVVLGAAKSWNNGTDADSSDYECAVSELLYDDPTGVTVSLIKTLGDCEFKMSWGLFVLWYYGEKVYYGAPLPTAENAPEFVDNADKCFALAESFRKIGSGEVLHDLSLAAEATGYLSLAFARMLDGRDLNCRSNFLRWSEEYEKSWLRDNKASELHLIIDVMKKALFE